MSNSFRGWSVSVDEFSFVNVNLSRGLHAKDILNPGWVCGQTDVHEKIEAIFKQVNAIIGNFLHSATNRSKKEKEIVNMSSCLQVLMY